MADLLDSLLPERALIWRIVHRDNLPWILGNGLHCGNSEVRSPGWVSIGSADLIAKRARWPVPVPPGGTLNDYVPFYFTPFSVMLNNIRTGWGGVKRRANEEIVVLVSSLHRVRELGLPFLFTDRHAVVKLARFFSSLDNLGQVDWPLLRRRDFKRDPDDPEKVERYQAEALVHRHVPVQSLIGLVCYTDGVCEAVEPKIAERGLAIKVVVRPQWYFR